MNTGLTDRASKIIKLRALVAQHLTAPAPQPRARLPTGLPQLDEALEGGLWKGGMVELLAPRRSGGSATLLCAVLQHFAAQNLWSALIDGADSFDPPSAGAQALSRLLWVRCHSAAEALQSTDLLLRDGNLPFICLDLHSNPAPQLRAVPSTSWYRFQRIIEPTAVALLAITPSPLIPCADVRVELESVFTLEALDQSATTLRGGLQLRLRRSRAALAEPMAWSQSA